MNAGLIKSGVFISSKSRKNRVVKVRLDIPDGIQAKLAKRTQLDGIPVNELVDARC